ncbi:hypothetical protein, partial [Bacillus thuringiensis]|uniref:hypothetical protein n=1 Tax=Bacillus thuringiensis TaxID=1428 RepID=UPI0019D69310
KISFCRNLHIKKSTCAKVLFFKSDVIHYVMFVSHGQLNESKSKVRNSLCTVNKKVPVLKKAASKS